MTVDTTALFAQVIQDHLELKRRNAALEHEMPIEKYMTDDPFENHPLFKTEEQARVEDTMDGVQSIVDEPTSLDWPSDETFTSAPAIEAQNGAAPEETVKIPGMPSTGDLRNTGAQAGPKRKERRDGSF